MVLEQIDMDEFLFISQEHHFACISSAIENILRYWGNNTSQFEIACLIAKKYNVKFVDNRDYSNLSKYLFFEKIVEALKDASYNGEKFEFKLLDKDNYKNKYDTFWFELQKHIRRKIPVIISLKSGGFRHAVIVTSVDEKSVKVFNPSNGVCYYHKNDLKGLLDGKWHTLIIIKKSPTK